MSGSFLVSKISKVDIKYRVITLYSYIKTIYKVMINRKFDSKSEAQNTNDKFGGSLVVVLNKEKTPEYSMVNIDLQFYYINILI